ncbi:hypothetical protein AAHH67_15665 [Niallia circulans]
MNNIISKFESWADKYQEFRSENDRNLFNSRMYRFIVALELSGKDKEANECKRIYNKLFTQ